MAYLSKNPFTNKVEQEYPVINNQILDKKISKANAAFDEWKSTSLEKRSGLLEKVADLLNSRKVEYGQMITFEMGKSISQAISEVEKCAWVCRYYAENAANFLKPRDMDSTASTSFISYEPLGAVLAVMPWNFPFWQVFRFIAPAAMAGNVGFLKHASNVPQCGNAIEQVFIDAGFPDGFFQNLFVDYDQVEKLIASTTVKAVTLTGSNYAGSKIAEIAGKCIKKTVLELGGSDPFIVCEDAQLNEALEKAMMSRFLNNGQSCIAAKRFILHENIAEEFLNNFQALIENMKIGDPMDKETFLGPLVNEKALSELENQVEKSIEMGGLCYTGGRRHPKFNSIYEPTIIVDPPREAPVWEEEVFGPVAAVCTFKTDDEALLLANDTRFGLGSAVWTTDTEKAEWFVKHINAGTVVVNGMVKSEPGLPFGGVKDSGHGRELSDYGIYEFLNIKTVSYF